MIAFVQANTKITDFSIGSVIRTILEAAAVEDDEQYFQMVQLLDAFSIRSSSGVDLDARVSDYGVVRLQPTLAAGKILIRDGLLVSNTLAFDATATDVTVSLESTERFPTVGFPYTVRIGEGTTAVEEVTVSANNTGTAILTVSALSNNHSIGGRISVVSGASDIVIPAGLKVQVPTSGDSTPVMFNTVESGTIVNGNYNSTPISAKATTSGGLSNIGAGRVTQFTSAPPFNGASVTNLGLFTGGGPVESDADLQDRALEHLQSLGKGTPLALKEAVLGVTDPVTGQTITTANVLERFSTDEVIVYVDDGSGFVPDQVVLTRDSLDTDYFISTGTLSVSDSSDFTTEGFLLVSPESAQAEVVEFTDTNYGSDSLTLASSTVNAHDSGDEVVQVEVLSASSDAGVDFYGLAKFPILRNSQRIWVGPSASNLTLQVEGVDYYINKARGKLEFLNPITAGSFIAATYTYYIGLIFQAQRFINGSAGDETAFPGVVAAGIEATVETPTIRRVTVRLSITSNDGFEDSNLAVTVRAAIESYIIALGIGEDVIVSEMIERAMSVPGVYNVIVQEPSTDISVSSKELPVPVSSLGTTLVTVN